MPRISRLTAAAICTILACACEVFAQPSTTVITHGFSAGSKGLWVQGMAEAILARAGNQGTCYRYEESTGLWNRVITVNGNNTSNVLVLIFNWQPESAGVSAGPNWNYVQAAADAMYGALRSAHYGNPIGSPPVDLVTGRKVHFIGHSRGTCVNSEAVRRLAWANIPVDQVTNHDPHPVNGTLDPPLNFNWGDPTPVKWNNTAWADNYWRADSNFADFDGIPLADNYNIQPPLSDSVLDTPGYSGSHSDVHLWYHGTIDLGPTPYDGEQTITATMRANWWNPGGYTQRGYYWSFLGGGSAFRPAGQPVGTAPTDPGIIYNGDFASSTYAGWTYHGGSVSGSISSQPDGTQLRIGAGTPGTNASHNRFFLPATASDVQFGLRVVTAAADETLRVSLVDFGGATTVIDNVSLSPATAGFVNHVLPIACSVPRNKLYRLTLQIVNGAGTQDSVAGIDNVHINPTGPVSPPDVNLDGLVNIDDLVLVITSWGWTGSPSGVAPLGNPADVNHNGAVNIDDLVAVITGWGVCQ